MPYTPDGRFYHSRRLDHGDTHKMASERLARDVETFLFDESAPGYMKPEFLSWSLARYDATKSSSGNIVGADYWDPDDESVYTDDVPRGKRFPHIALKHGDDFRASGLRGSSLAEGKDSDALLFEEKVTRLMEKIPTISRDSAVATLLGELVGPPSVPFDDAAGSQVNVQDADVVEDAEKVDEPENFVEADAPAVDMINEGAPDHDDVDDHKDDA